MTALDDIKSLLRNEDVVQVCLTGKMGRGKTNALKYLVKLHKSDESYYFNVHDSGGFKSVIEAMMKLKGHKVKGKGRVALLFDDISWYAMHYSEQVEQFLQLIANIRRLIHARRYLIAVVQHYPYATLPFIRESHVYAVFSITSKEEYEAFSEIFSKRYLKRFKKLFRNEVLEGKKGLMLVNVLGKQEIIRFPKVKGEPWTDMTVRADILSEEREYYTIVEHALYSNIKPCNGTTYVYVRLYENKLKELLEKARNSKERAVLIPVLKLKRVK